MKRRYNYLKEKVTDFIDDDDHNVELKVPNDFPEDIPEGAYQAYIDARCAGYEEGWNAEDFKSEYYGFYDSMEEFVEIQFLDENIDKDTYKDMYNSLYQDPFFECVDLYTFGRELYHHYEPELKILIPEEDEYDASEFIGDYDEIIDPLPGEEVISFLFFLFLCYPSLSWIPSRAVLSYPLLSFHFLPYPFCISPI